MKNNIVELCESYKDNKNMIEELEAMNQDIKTQLLIALGDADTMTAGCFKINNKAVNSVRFDSKALKSEHPDIYTCYAKESTYKRFTVI